jgi:hypothetical protein
MRSAAGLMKTTTPSVSTMKQALGHGVDHRLPVEVIFVALQAG